MNSRDHSSEDELGRQSAARIAAAQAPRVLIGGLGFGLHAARRARCVACPRRRSTSSSSCPRSCAGTARSSRDLAGEPLADPRVTVIEDDVKRVIDKATGYDAIVLDVDNGPNPIYDGNAELYKRRGLSAAKAALAPGGWLAVWSAFRARRSRRGCATSASSPSRHAEVEVQGRPDPLRLVRAAPLGPRVRAAVLARWIDRAAIAWTKPTGRSTPRNGSKRSAS